MTALVYTDPETGEEVSIDLDGWRFRVTLGGQALADVAIVPHFLSVSIDLETDTSDSAYGGPRGVAPVCVTHVDGVPCVAAYVKEPHSWA